MTELMAQWRHVSKDLIPERQRENRKEQKTNEDKGKEKTKKKIWKENKKKEKCPFLVTWPQLSWK